MIMKIKNTKYKWTFKTKYKMVTLHVLQFFSKGNNGDQWSISDKILKQWCWCMILLFRKYEWKIERSTENYLSNLVACLNEDIHLINKETFNLDCNHRFCNECRSDYIISAINNKSFDSIFI
eukprot:99935_1